MNTLQYITKGLLRLAYPDDCPGCRKPALSGHLFCSECTYHLRINDMHRYRDNLFTLHFRGRIPFISGTAMFIYRKGGRVQTLIQSIKYRGSKHTAFKIGLLYGHILKSAPLYQGIDTVIPVPIHPKKKKIRGFNQSAWFSRGLAQQFDVRHDTTSVVRLEMGPSQTKHNRWERAQNLIHAFGLTGSPSLEGKNVLIVDDVLTTGATLESMALTILPAKPASIRFCTLAMGLR